MTLRAWFSRSLPRRARQRRARRPVFFQPRLQHLEDRSLPSTVTWTGPNGGDWDTGSNWSTGMKPGAGDDAVLNEAGLVLVTHQTAAVDPVHSISSTGATIDMSAGTLDVSGTLSVTGASVYVKLRGSSTLANANIQSGTRVTGSGGTLSAATLDGSLDLSGNYETANVANGLTLAGGSVNVTGNGAVLQFTGTQTLGGTGAVNIGRYSGLQASGTGASLTIDTNVTVNGGTLTGTDLVLRGTVQANNLPLSITAAHWTNYGTLRTIGSGGLVLGAAGTSWSNAMSGIISAGGLTTAGTWSSPGAIGFGGATWYMGGSFHSADLDNFTISASTIVHFSGTLTNTGRTLTLDANRGNWYADGGGQIIGGTIAIAGTGSLQVRDTGLSLDGVTVAGRAIACFGPITVRDGLTFANGSISMGLGGTTSPSLQFIGTQTLGGTGTVSSSQGVVQVTGSNATLTVGANVVLQGAMTLSGPNLDLQGTIQGYNAGHISIQTGTLTNEGLLWADGGRLDVTPTSWSSTSTGKVWVNDLGGYAITVCSFWVAAFTPPTWPSSAAPTERMPA